MRRRSVLQPLSGEPPSEFKLFSMGENPATDGLPAIVEPADVNKIMSAYNKLGRPLAGKIEHNRGDTACRFGLEPREDGIYAVDLEWTPKGVAKWAGWESSYISPEFNVDSRGHVTMIWGAGLTDDPASYNPVSVHQRSVQGMPLLADALMSVAPEGACSCEVTTDNRVIYYLSDDDSEERIIVMDYTIDGSGIAKLAGRPVETEIAVVVVEPAEDAQPIPIVTTFEAVESPEPVEIERACAPVKERAMIDDSPVLAKFPGAAVSGLCLTMPDGSMACVDLQGNPMPEPMAPVAQIPVAPVADVPPVAPVMQSAMDPNVMRALVEEQVQRSIEALKPVIAESITQPVQLVEPPSVRLIPASGPIDRSMRR